MFKRILFIGAHADDECCCAGTLYRSLEEGSEVFLATLSFCEEDSKQLGFPPDILKSEFECCVETLGINKNNIYTSDYPVRNFPQYRQEILDYLVLIKKEVKPDLVLIPSSIDIHQDHKVVYEEGMRAFAYSSILGYETPKNLLPQKHICYIDFKKRHFEVKEKCRACYQSQDKRAGIDRETKLLLARIRGSQIGCEYAEGYETLCLKI
jgi:N-acetylglucosamine malate deacetylase 1